MGKRILVVAHDEAGIEDLKNALVHIGLEPVSARDRSGALTLFEELNPAAILIAVARAGPDAIDMVETIRQTQRGAVLPLLLMGTGADGETITSPSEALEIGADYYFRLPTDVGYLAGRVAGWVGETHSTRPRSVPRPDPDSSAFSLDIDLEALHVVTGFDQEAVTEHGLPTLDLLKQLDARREPGAQDETIDDEDETTRALFDDPDESIPPERAPSRQVELALELVREGERHRHNGEKKEAIEAYWAAAELYVLDGRADAAIALYKLTLYLEPTRLAVAKHGAQIALGAGRKKDALDMLRHTAGALEEAGELEQATAALKEMVQLSPSEPTLVLRLASIESKRRRPEGEPPPNTSPPAPERHPSPPPRRPPPRPADAPKPDVNEDNWESMLDDELASRDDPSLPSIELSQSQMVAMDSIGPKTPPPKPRPPMFFTNTTREVAPQEIAPLILEERRVSPAAADEVLNSDTVEMASSMGLRVPNAVTIPDEEHPDHAQIEWGEADEVEGPPARPKELSKHRRPRPEPSRITFAPLVPNHGRIDRLMDGLEVFASAATQRVTGMLVLGQGDDAGLVFVEGHPAARRGPEAATRLAQLLEQADIASAVGDGRPAEAIRRVIADGSIDEDSANAILLRHLEDGVLAVLMHRGAWRFLQGGEVDVTTAEIVRDRDASLELLVELLPKVAPALELASHLGGMRTKITVQSLGEAGLSARDARFCGWLDGTKPLDTAATLSGLNNDRAAAIALLLVAFGHATSSGQAPAVERAPTPTPPSIRPVAAPHRTLADLDEDARVRALAELVRTSDYFTILGVDASATKTDIDQAHHSLRANIRVQQFEGDPQMLDLAREVIRSLDEARDVLKVPELRAAYQRHLKP